MKEMWLPSPALAMRRRWMWSTPFVMMPTSPQAASDAHRLELDAEALHLEEVFRHRALLEALPEIQVDGLVVREQRLARFVQAEFAHGAGEGELFGSPEVEQGIVQVEQEQLVFHGACQAGKGLAW